MKFNIIFFLIPVLLSCRKNFFTREPYDRQMTYYTRNYLLPSDAELRTDGVYYYVSKKNDNISVVKFFPNGKITSIVCVDAIICDDGRFDHTEIRGYYTIVSEDTIKFSKNAHYYRKPQECMAVFSLDTLFIKRIDNNKPIYKKIRPFLFLKKGDTLKTGINMNTWR